ncbi:MULTISPECIES: hypothetical protein [unclassified Paludibacterium]|uniref:hypothetical protein n=1 Tax=unclassified Paludibacterium TaxID=2618429 RepID=UPI001C046B1A|nr:hypothetical protein [Paludibacterium sp. B53371]BEV71332.1 hypothetical protein THUN1379_08140 [Paludibacterium sp. THUN1379]
MNASQILSFMIQAKTGQQIKWAAIPALYAVTLAQIAPKLSEEELFSMIAIGSVLYDHSSKEIVAQAATDQLLKSLMNPGNTPV